jgi:hypothetical protein
MKTYHIDVASHDYWTRQFTISALNWEQAKRLAERRLDLSETIVRIVELPTPVRDPYQQVGYADSMGLWRGIGYSCLFLVIVVALVLLGILLFHHFAWPVGWR